MYKNPTLRKLIRNLFRDRGLVTVVPTERGITQIDDYHPFFVCSSLPTLSEPLIDPNLPRSSSPALQIHQGEAHRRTHLLPSFPPHARSREGVPRHPQVLPPRRRHQSTRGSDLLGLQVGFVLSEGGGLERVQEVGRYVCCQAWTGARWSCLGEGVVES